VPSKRRSQLERKTARDRLLGQTPPNRAQPSSHLSPRGHLTTNAAKNTRLSEEQSACALTASD
jgi:hypothetical protein